MSSTGLSAFDETLNVTHGWLRRLMEHLGTDSRADAYAALRATLHALRDHLQPNDAVHLGAQLPMLVRGFYYDGWHPADKPLKDRSQEGFIDEVRGNLRGYEHLDPDDAVCSVFQLLSERLDRGEVDKVKHVLPRHIRELWPE